MGRMGRGHDPWPHAMSRGPVLIGGEVRVRCPYGGVAGRAAIDPDAKGLHDRHGLRGDLGDRREVEAILVQRLAAARAYRIGQSDFDRWGGPLVGSGQSAEGEASLARLSSRAFGLGLASPLGEGGGLSLGVPLVLTE